MDKIKEIFALVEKDGKYEIRIAKSDDELINESFMETINNGIDLYKEYLEKGVANKENLDLIKGIKNKIIIENVNKCNIDIYIKL